MDLIGDMRLAATGPLKTGMHSTNIYARLGKRESPTSDSMNHINDNAFHLKNQWDPEKEYF